MFAQNKTLLILLIAALGMVAAAAAIRSNEIEEIVSETRIFLNNTNNSSYSTSPEFFEKPQKESSMISTKQNITKNDSKIANTQKETTAPRKENFVTAKAYVVGNLKTGKIYFGSNSGQTMPVASVSKLITAITALDNLSSTTTVQYIDANTVYDADPGNFIVGEKFTSMELINSMLVASSNNAAEALASTFGRVKFLELMSGYAWEIGMSKAFFADPSGISPRNSASAQELFNLAKYLYFYHPDILGITKIKSFELASTTEHAQHIFQSTHPFVNDQRFLGGKTGRTPEAGETMLTILNIDDEPVAFIVLGSQSREADTKYLINKLGKIN